MSKSILVGIVTLLGALFFQFTGSDVLGFVIILALLFLIIFIDASSVDLLKTISLFVGILPYFNFSFFPFSGVYFIMIIYIIKRAPGIFRKQLYKVGENLVILFFLLIVLLSTFFSIDQVRHISIGIQVVISMLFFVLVSSERLDVDQYYGLFRYLWIGTIVISIIGLLQVLGFVFIKDITTTLTFNSIYSDANFGTNNTNRLGEEYINSMINRSENIGGGGNLYRAIGTLEGSTVLGWFLLFPYLIGLCGYYFKNDMLKLRTKNTIFLVLLCLVFSWSRSAILIAVISTLILLFFKKKNSINLGKLMRAIIIFVCLFIGLTGLMTLLPSNAFTSVFTSSLGLFSGNYDGSSLGRIYTVLAGINYIIEKPFVGVGLGNYGYVLSLLTGVEEYTFATAHNTFIELWCELGILGLILFVLIFYFLLKKGVRVYNLATNKEGQFIGMSMLILTISFLILCLFGGSIVHPKTFSLLWLVLGLLNSYIISNEENIVSLSKNTI